MYRTALNFNDLIRTHSQVHDGIMSNL